MSSTGVSARKGEGVDLAGLLTVCFPSHGGGPGLSLDAVLLHPALNTLQDCVKSQPATQNNSDLLQKLLFVNPGSQATVEFVHCFINKIKLFLQAQRPL